MNVVESEELVQFVFPFLLTMDYSDLRVKVFVAGGSFAFFTTIFAVTLFICSLFPMFQNMGLKFRVFLSLSVVRGIFGIFATLIGSYAIFYTTNLSRDIVFGTNVTSHIGMLTTMGFFIFELSAVIISDVAFRSFSKMLIIHHALGVVSYSVAISLSANFSIGCKALILEMSTPFSCLSYLLMKVGMERSFLWRFNQMILVHTFHLRSVVECYLWYITFQNWQYIWNFLPTSLFILTYLSLVLVTFVMTPYWGYKKTQQLFNPVDWNFEDSSSHASHHNVSAVNGVVKKTI